MVPLAGAFLFPDNPMIRRAMKSDGIRAQRYDIHPQQHQEEQMVESSDGHVGKKLVTNLLKKSSGKQKEIRAK